MRQWLKYAVDYGPLLAFFIAYKVAGLMAATLALMIATAVATLLLYVMTRRLAVMPIITFLVVGTFGGLIMKKPLIRYLMGSTLHLDDAGWNRLSLRFACFFAVMAVLNEIVWRT